MEAIPYMASPQNSVGRQGLKPSRFGFLKVAAEAATHKDAIMTDD
jgi:hypothetical protein